MKNMADTFSIDYTCYKYLLSKQWFYNVSRPIPRNKIGKHTQENIFLIKIPKILRVFAQDVPYGMKAYVLWKYRLVNDLSVSLSTQINIYCLMTNQMPALLVQRAPWTRAAVLLLQSLYFSCPPPTRAIIPDARPLGTFQNQDVAVTVRRAISKRSHEKIGDGEQSNLMIQPWLMDKVLFFFIFTCTESKNMNL